jgi:hypothetical protein
MCRAGSNRERGETTGGAKKMQTELFGKRHGIPATFERTGIRFAD